MEYTRDGQLITVMLPEKIDSDNAHSVQKEFEKILKNNSNCQIKLDAAGMDYITSAGLRMMLVFQKKGILNEIVNVNNAVYGVFDVTGFLEVFTVHRAREVQETGQDNLIGEDAYGKLYIKDEDDVIRIWNPDVPEEDIERGITCSKIALKLNVTNAIVVGKAETDEGIGRLYAVDSVEGLVRYLKRKPRERKKVIASIVRQLDVFRFNQELRETVYSLYEKYMRLVEETSVFDHDEKKAIVDYLTMLSRNNHVIFENLNAHTMLCKNGDVIFVDLSRLCYGNPIFALAGMYRNRIENGELLGDCEENGERAWKELLTGFYPKYNMEELAVVDRVARSYGHLFSVLGYHGKREGENITEAANYVRKEFTEDSSLKEAVIRLKKLQDKEMDRDDECLNIDIRERTASVLFRKKTLLKDIRMTIRPGEMVLLLGGSGAGKTTFLNAVTGYEKANATITRNGMNLYTDYEVLKHKIAFAPQQDLLRDEDTVYNTLRNAADMRLPVETTKEEKEEAVQRMLEIFGLVEQRDNVIRTLSGGQRKRASIAVEFIADPTLFFLDEPDSGLDGVMARSLMEDLRKVTGEDKIIVVISHAPDRAIELFDKVIILAKSMTDGAGHLAFYGSPADAREFFGCEKMEEILKMVNKTNEGGEGRADEFIEKFEQWR